MLWRHRVVRCRFGVGRSYLQVLFGGKGHTLQNDLQIDWLLRNPFHMVNGSMRSAIAGRKGVAEMDTKMEERIAEN